MKSKDEENIYDEKFFSKQMNGSYLSAKYLIGHLLTVFKPKSVVDMGCGKGMWLQVFGENGIDSLMGIDGFCVNKAATVNKPILFLTMDLNQPIFIQNKKFDLAISLEVAEHLEEKSAQIFIENLISLSDVIMFSAAYTKQGGDRHLNEQKHTYWANIFIKHNYFPYDFFRPFAWGNNNIDFWYQQNSFLYIKNTSEVNNIFNEKGFYPLKNIEFMNCIHPKLYEYHLFLEKKYRDRLL